MGKQAEAVRAEFEQFKQAVRAEALRVAREMDWCDSGVNDSFRRLGLPEKRDVRVRVRVAAHSEREYVLRVSDAENEEQARELLAADGGRRLEREVRDQVGIYTRDGVEISLVEPPAPVDPTAVPAVGQPVPAEGDWYRSPQVSNDPAQCREREANEVWYCTRPAGHEVSEESPHVAAGRTEGVKAVWSTGGVPRAEFEARDDDEPTDRNW